jgi:hypothetical protein
MTNDFRTSPDLPGQAVDRPNCDGKPGPGMFAKRTAL